MCRNIRPLHNFEPPATRTEIEAAALQFVRKVSGSARPAKDNQAAFDIAVSRIAAITEQLLDAMISHAPPKNRDVEAAKAKARSAARFA